MTSPTFPDPSDLDRLNSPKNPTTSPGTAPSMPTTPVAVPTKLPPPDQATLNTLNNLMGSNAVKNDLRVVVPNSPQFDLPGDLDGNLVGININSLDGEFLPCWVQAFENMEGHTVDIYFQNGVGVPVTPPYVWSSRIPLGHQAAFQLDIPKALVREGTFELFALIINSTGVSRETPRLIVKIDLQAPGGVNMEPVTAVLANPGVIGAQDLRSGITFTVPSYPGRQQYDTIQLELPGEIEVGHLLQEAPENTPVDIFVGPENLVGFADLKEARVTYRIFDNTRNWSLSSQIATFMVDNIENPLPAPTLMDGVDSTINLATLPWDDGRSGRDTRVSVPVGELGAGTLVKLTWSTTTAAGGSASGTLEQTVGVGGEPLLFDVPDDFNVTLQAGRLLVSYTAAGRTSSSAAANLEDKLTDRPLSFGADHTQTAGLRYIILEGTPPRLPTEDSEGSYLRKASGGLPPYTYTTQPPGIAQVSNEGLVVGAANGTTKVIATDRKGVSASYSITFEAIRLVKKQANQLWSGNINDPSRPEWHSLHLMQMQSFWEQYQNHVPGKSVAEALGWGDSYFWTGSNWYGGGYAYVIDLSNLKPDFRGEEIRAGGERLPSLFKVGGWD